MVEEINQYFKSKKVDKDSPLSYWLKILDKYEQEFMSNSPPKQVFDILELYNQAIEIIPVIWSDPLYGLILIRQAVLSPPEDWKCLRNGILINFQLDSRIQLAVAHYNLAKGYLKEGQVIIERAIARQAQPIHILTEGLNLLKSNKSFVHLLGDYFYEIPKPGLAPLTNQLTSVDEIEESVEIRRGSSTITDFSRLPEISNISLHSDVQVGNSMDVDDSNGPEEDILPATIPNLPESRVLQPIFYWSKKVRDSATSGVALTADLDSYVPTDGSSVKPVEDHSHSNNKENAFRSKRPSDNQSHFSISYNRPFKGLKERALEPAEEVKADRLMNIPVIQVTPESNNAHVPSSLPPKSQLILKTPANYLSQKDTEKVLPTSHMEKKADFNLPETFSRASDEISPTNVSNLHSNLIANTNLIPAKSSLQSCIENSSHQQLQSINSNSEILRNGVKSGCYAPKQITSDCKTNLQLPTTLETNSVNFSDNRMRLNFPQTSLSCDRKPVDHKPYSSCSTFDINSRRNTVASEIVSSVFNSRKSQFSTNLHSNFTGSSLSCHEKMSVTPRNAPAQPAAQNIISKPDNGQRNTLSEIPMPNSNSYTAQKCNLNPQILSTTKQPILSQKPSPDKMNNKQAPISNHFTSKQDSNCEPIKCDQSQKKYPQPKVRLPEDFKVKGRHYLVLDLIGYGGASNVYSVLDRENKKILAIKVVSIVGLDQLVYESFMKEIEMLNKLKESGRVIELIDFEVVENNLLIVLEKAETDLKALFSSQKEDFKDFSTIIHYWKMMLKGVKTLHDKGIVHLDLKPNNFVLVKGVVKLIDLGISQELPSDLTRMPLQLQMGTVNYMSPEQLTCEPMDPSSDSAEELEFKYKVGRKSDVWSLGVILYTMVYGHSPFHLMPASSRMLAICNPNMEIVFPRFGCASLYKALTLCLVRSVSKRASVEDLLNIEYIERETTPIVRG